MTYAQFGLIEATDYNTLVSNGTNIADHWGTGTTSHGLGQSTSAIATVSTANSVTATQWTGLIQTINSCLSHQGQTNITPSSVTAGTDITFYNSISTGSALAYTNAGTTGLTTVDGTTNTTSYAAAWGTGATPSLEFTQSVTFTSGDAARYFFNAGGKLKLSFARSGGSSTTANTNWSALCTALGTIIIGYKNTTKTGGSGTPTVLLNSDNGGYWSSTDSYITQVTQYDTASSYTTNYIKIECNWSGTAANGGKPVLNIRVTYMNAVAAMVDGTTSTSLIISAPATTYITNTWGTPAYIGSVTYASEGTVAVDIGDTIPYSMMLNSASSQYLSRAFGSPTNNTVWTFSFWIKRGKISRREAYLSDAAWNHGLYMNSNDALYINGSETISTAALFRDPTAWQHIVAVNNGTTSTIYRDNVQIMSGTTTITLMNSAGSKYLFGQTSAGGYSDAYVANVNFVDGQALTPSSFGRVSPDTGQWVNKTYTGTYGNNGFKLDFANSAALGYDTSVLSLSDNLRTLGTNIGGMTAYGGLASAFDGVISGNTSSAASGTYTPGYINESAVGKDWGPGVTKTITAFRMSSPTDCGFNGGNAALGYKLQGSTDNFSSSVVDLYSGTTPAGANQTILVTRGITTTTAYRYHRIVLSGNGINWSFISELELYESVSASYSYNLRTLGTNIGGMTANGGLAAAFNDDATTGYIDSARSGSISSGYVALNSVGKDWGSGVTKTITAFKLKSPTDCGFSGDNAALGYKLQGSTDDFSSSVVDLYSGTTPSGANLAIAVTSGITTTTAYRYHRIVLSGNGASNTYVAELELYEAGTFSIGNRFNLNDWTLNNITSANQYTDTPTNNYCVLNSVNKSLYTTLSKGNSVIAGASSAVTGGLAGTMAANALSYSYWEVTVTSVGTSTKIGIAANDNTTYPNVGDWHFSSHIVAYKMDGTKNIDTTNSAYGNSFTTNDVIGVAVDWVNSAIYFAKNNTWQNSGVPTSGATKTGAISFTVGTNTWFPYCTVYSDTTLSFNFGARAFTYTPPTGFSALCTVNLPEPTIKKPETHMIAKTRLGTGATYSVSGLLFSPGLVWTKSRSSSTDHQLFDISRGVQQLLISNRTDAETTQSTGLTAFNSDGYTGGALTAINSNASSYVDWMWKAGGAAVSNTAGSITSLVSANTTAGISIVSYTGSNANVTVGHGLGVAPKMIIVKCRNPATPYGWFTYHASTASPTTTRLELQSTSGSAVGTTNPWNSTAPTSSVFSLYSGSSYPEVNENGKNHVAYCFAEVPGFSKFGSYTGNGATDGPVVYCGFLPEWVMLKDVTTGGTSWYIMDAARNTYNLVSYHMRADSTLSDSVVDIDFVASGFKLRGLNSNINNSGATIVYAAFAKAPFKYSNTF